MKRTAWWMLLGWCAAGVCVGIVGGDLFLARGRTPITIPLYGGGVPLIAGLLLTWQGWQVRRLRFGRRSRVSRLGAARVLVLAWSCSRAGAVLAGVSGGYWLMVRRAGSSAFLTEQMNACVIAFLGSVALCGAGVVVEKWCHIDDDAAPGSAPA